MHNKVSANTRFMLLEQSDWGYAQADGIPDSWVIRGTADQDLTGGKVGPRCLSLNGEASQVVYLSGETDPTDGGSHYNAFIPLPADLQRHIRDGALRFGVWCKTQETPTEPTLSITVEYSAGEKITAKSHVASFGKGSHEWEYLTVDFPTLPDAGIAHAATIKLTGGGGKVWFDGASCTQAETEPINFLPNGDFELRENHFPVGWNKPQLWSWSRREYYRFTGWSHEAGGLRGDAAVADGAAGLQLTVYPGDNFAVRGDPIALNQQEARPLRISALIAADNLRWFDIMAQDEAGEWLPQLDFAGFMGTDENYRNRLLAAGTHDTEYVSKYLAPRKPVKKITLFLCVRGIDGRLMDKNVVGTAIVEDVELRESGLTLEAARARGLHDVRPTALPAPGQQILTLGERLWGSDALRVSGPANAMQSLRIIDPSGQKQSVIGEDIRQPDGTPACEFRYRIDSLCTDWQQQFKMIAPWAPNLAFGTTSSPISVRLTNSYVYPDEKVSAAINLNVSTPALAEEIGSVRIALRSPAGERVLLETNDPAKAFWSSAIPRSAILEEGFADARNLIVVPIETTGLPVHPANEPVRDTNLVVTLKDKAGKIVAEQSSDSFGMMQHPAPPALPDKIEKTSLSPTGQMLVNGNPFFFRPFPLDKTDLGEMSRMHHFPKSYKILPLPFPTDLLFKPDDDAQWKQKVQTFVRDAKDDPKLFGYFFNHNGETTFWLDQWKQMAACQRKVAGWVREIDPNHLVLSAEWLFGHGALTPQAAKEFDFLDIIDVEPGLQWTPDSNAVREATGRPIAIVAGLETYYSQSPALIRWRMYEALRQGATDVGICPSGMLGPKPETITFLRGLYGELSGLEPMLTASAPKTPARCDNPAINIWQRDAATKRYVIAMRRSDEKNEASLFRVSIHVDGLKAGKARVMFESRELTVTGDMFSDAFDSPYAVHVYEISR